MMPIGEDQQFYILCVVWLWQLRPLPHDGPLRKFERQLLSGTGARIRFWKWDDV